MALAISDLEPAAVGTRRVATITNLEAPLIRRAQAGNSDAVGELYGRHEPRVRRYLASRLRGGQAADIDDLVAATFLTAMERISTFELDRPGEFGCWLIGIARNKLLSWYWRPSHRETAVDEPWAAAGARGIVPAPDEAVSPEDMALDRLEVADLLDRLTPRARRALLLQHAADLPAAEVALALGTTKRSVAELISLARLELRGEAGVCACGCGTAVPPSGSTRAAPATSRRSPGACSAPAGAAWRCRPSGTGSQARHQDRHCRGGSQDPRHQPFGRLSMRGQQADPGRPTGPQAQGPA